MLPIQLKIFLALLLCLPLAAATWNSDGTASDTQSKINSASHGDTVVIGSAGATNWWSTGITNNKGIYIDGNGGTVARTNNGANTLLAITVDPTYKCELFNITFDNGNIAQSNNISQVSFSGAFTNQKFRVYNATFKTTLGSAVLVRVYTAWGLFHDCTFIADDAAEMLHNEGNRDNTTSNSGWNETITPGSGDAVYVEDSTFQKYDMADAFYWGTSALQMFYGTRTVVRFCTLNGCQLDVHGTAGNVAGRWFEFYGNTLYTPGTMNQANHFDIRGGSGIICSNEMTGTGISSPGRNLRVDEEDSGSYPELWQVGRGKNTTHPPTAGSDQASDPAYFWDNDADLSVSLGNPTLIQEDRDYILSAHPSWTSYTYPHPLRVDGGGAASGSGKGRGQLGTAGRFRMR